MAVFQFTLWLENTADKPSIKRRLIERGASFDSFHDWPCVLFRRNADELCEAVIDAMEAVRDVGLAVAQIGVYDFVNAAEIARRTARTRANITQLISGKRGPGKFPASALITGNSPLWHWDDVEAWFAEYENRPKESVTESNQELRRLNALLQALRAEPNKRKRNRLLNALQGDT